MVTVLSSIFKQKLKSSKSMVTVLSSIFKEKLKSSKSMVTVTPIINI
jgi:hypothetical protein